MPSFARTTGNNVTATITLISGISIPAYPIERRNGSGSTIIASKPIATVVPLNTTARPAVCIARTTASSPSKP